jgi:hypothetical protein
MNWLNLNVQVLDSENFLGSDPVDRATWLCLLRYCIGQENAGVIAECKDWADRKWQQLVRVTKKEAERKCDLWAWHGETLTVWGYPAEKEDEIQQKRERAKTNGAKGGRPKTTDTVTQKKPTLVHSAKAEGERKGKEGEREGEGEIKEPSPTADLPAAQEPANDKWTDSLPTANAKDFHELEAWINSLHPSWKKRPHFSRIEREELLANSRIFFDLTERDKALLARYIDVAIDESWGKFWQPDQRGQLVRSVLDVLSHADRWEKECRKRKCATGIAVGEIVQTRDQRVG